MVRPLWDGFVWISKCILLATFIAIGWKTGRLQEASNVAIIAFVIWQGCRPFLTSMFRLVRELRMSRAELNELQQMPRESLPMIASIDTSDAGPTLKLTVAVARNQHRASKQTIVADFVEQSREVWKHRITPILTAADQAPMAGLGGSLLGILSGVTELSAAMQNGAMEVGFVEMLNSMATMVSTTVIGAAGAFLLIGLASIAQSAVDRHLAELKTIGSMLFGEPPNEENDDDSDPLL